MTTKPGGDRSAAQGLRFRRLISFLRRHRLYGTAHSLERETRVFFDAAHLRRMLLHDRWAAASSYALRFLDLRDCSREAAMLRRYIFVFRVIAGLAAGHPLTRADDAQFQHFYDNLLGQPNCDARRRVMLTWRSDQHTKLKAVDDIMYLVANCPELKPKLARLPHCTSDSTSLGPRLWGSTITTRRKNKHGRILAHVIAASFLRKRPSEISQKTHHSALHFCVLDQAATSSSWSARKVSSDQEPVAEAVSEPVEIDDGGVQHRQTPEGESADQLRSKRVSRPNPKYYGPDWRCKQVRP